MNTTEDFTYLNPTIIHTTAEDLYQTIKTSAPLLALYYIRQVYG